MFTYTPIYDVVEVNQVGYDTCMISNAISAYDTGETVIHLTEPGTRYFVCGRSGHCQQGLKLQVQVLPQPSNNGTNDDNNGGSTGEETTRSPPSHAPGPRSPPHRHPPPSPQTHSSSPPPPPDDDDDDDVPLPPFPFCDHPPSGAAMAIMTDSTLLCHGLLPLITLIFLSYTRVRFFFFFTFWRFLFLIG